MCRFAGRVQARGLVVLVLPAITLSLPLVAFAQLEEITVTTRKRAENLQEVPIAIDAFSADVIDRQAIRDLADLQQVTPSLIFDEGFGKGDTRITFRGLTNTRGRSNVAYLLDSIDFTSIGVTTSGTGLLINSRLLDLERIEVVKGPQSALYGRSAFAGAVNYISKDPTDELEATVGMSLAEDASYELRGGLSGPVSQTLGLRLNGSVWQDERAAYRNEVSGADLGGGEGWGVALSGLWEPADRFRLRARAEYSDDEYEPPPRVLYDPAPIVIPEAAIEPPFLDEDGNPCAGPSVPGCIERPPVLAPSSINPPPPLADPPPPLVYLDAEGRECADPPAPECQLAILSQVREPANPRPRLDVDPLTGRDFVATDKQTLRSSLIATWETALGTLSSYTGYAHSEDFQGFDQDLTDIPDLEFLVRLDSDTELFSEELRFATALSGPLQLTVGTLLWFQDIDQTSTSMIVICRPNPIMAEVCEAPDAWQQVYLANQPQPPRPNQVDTDHLSVYAQLEWAIADDWKLTLEDRWVDEDEDVVLEFAGCTLFVGGNPFVAFGQVVANDTCPDPSEPLVVGPGDPVDPIFRGSTSTDYHAPKATLEWTPLEDSLVYLSWARAVKPGGINLSPGGGAGVPDITNLRFDPEKMEVYELGGKFTVFDGRLQTNLALFFEDFSNKQVNTQLLDPNVGLRAVSVNAAAAEVWGIEANIAWVPIDRLTLIGAYTWLDTEYVEFRRLGAGPDQIAQAGNCRPVFDPVTARTVCELDLSGNQLERAPKNSAVLTANWTAPLPTGPNEWFVEATTQYQDERFVDDLNYVALDSFVTVDARIGVNGERWEAFLFMDNVTDDDTIKTVGNTPDFINKLPPFIPGDGKFFTLPQPRTIGARASIRFGGPGR